MSTMKRIAALALVLILIVGALPGAQAAPSAAGCPKSSSGKHNWKPRPQSPWCERPGGIVYVCSHCGKKVFEESTPALGHAWDAWTVTKQAACASDGSRTRTCSRCGKEETQTIPAYGHAYSAWGVVVQPTCETAGEQAHVCASCGRTETKPVPPLGHQWDKGKVTQMPTATEEGVMTYTCLNDPGHTRTEAIPVTGGSDLVEGHPSLFLTLHTNAEIYQDDHETDHWSDDILVKITVTNTGDIPLMIDVFEHKHVIQPADSFTYKSDFTVWGGSWDTVNHDFITYTPDDPVYFGYMTVTYLLYGYDPDEVIKEPLCTSNHAVLIVRFPRNTEPVEPPALTLKKSFAAPKNKEYFTVGEPIHWILTATNTTEAPITDVTVTDKGVIVGTFSEIAPAETVTCSVPDHIVTAYEKDVVGYVKNAAVAEGKDADGHPQSWPSNEATAPTQKITGKEDDDVPNDGILAKAEAHSPENGAYYLPGEAVDYVITVRNTSDAALKDLILTDSLAGFTPIATLDSLAPGAMETFAYTYTVQESDAVHPFLVNSAILTYHTDDGMPCMPLISTVSSELRGTDPSGFDPDLLPREGDACRLTLDALGDTEARYTLRACAEHLPAARAAEAAAQEGDWVKAVEIWRGELEKQYAVLYAAGDSEAKSAVMEARAFFDAYTATYADAVNMEDTDRMRAETDRMYDMLLAAATGTRREALLAEREQLYAAIEAFGSAAKYAALAEMLRIRCALLCCAIHTMPEDLPGSLTGQHAALESTEKHETNGREISGLEGSDSTVVERFDAAGTAALKETARMAVSAGNRAVAFSRAAVVWQMALDDLMNPLYEAAAEKRKPAIAAWRTSLDSLLSAERHLLTLLYGGKRAIIEEQLMNLYKDAVLCTEKLR